jgi:rhamnosyltransferase
MEKVGFFDKNTLFAEDSLVIAKLMKLGFEVAYAPQAMVYNSHDYGYFNEFRRYFDVGAFHSLNKWIIRDFQSPNGEGLKFIKSEYVYLKRYRIKMILVRLLIRNSLRFSGYKLGRLQSLFPICLKIKISTNPSFWRSKIK